MRNERKLEIYKDNFVIMRRIFIVFCALLGLTASKKPISIIHNAVETEMLSIPISPNLFNWTYQEYDYQYTFHAAVQNKPELPSWLRYIYSERHHSGFIFGTPPPNTKNPIMLEVVGLNRQNYATRQILLKLVINPRKTVALHEVELKIDNLNVQDLLDEHRMTKLKDVLKTNLWPESTEDLYPTFLASAIDLGARLPLKPSDGEGVVIRFGSSVPFSEELKRLREEVRPLSRLTSCPREFKRTTVERFFRQAGFTLDWCSFELYNLIYRPRTVQRYSYLTEPPEESTTVQHNLNTWDAPFKGGLPLSQGPSVLFVCVFPSLLLLIWFGVMLCVLKAHVNGVSLYGSRDSNVEFCRFPKDGDPLYNEDGEEINHDNNDFESPNNSIFRPSSPKSNPTSIGNYNRPLPPPYMGSTTNSLHQRKSADRNTPSTSGHTPERRIQLEESLKMLNEANISGYPQKDPIVDMADGTDDYVPVKPYMEIYRVKAELADLQVDEDKKEEGGEPVKTWFC